MRYLSHTGDLLIVVTQHEFKGHLLVLPTSASTHNNKKPLQTLPAQISLLVSVPPLYNSEDGLTCCEWIMVNQLLWRWRSRKSSRLCEGRWEEAEGFSGGQLAPSEAGRRGSSFSPGSAAPKFQPRLTEQRVDVEPPLPQREYLGSLSDPPPFSFFTSLCTLSLPLSENWICHSPHHLFQGNSFYVDKQVPHLSLLSVSVRWKGLL